MADPDKVHRQDVGGDAAAFFGSLGIDPSQMPGGAGAAGPKVYMGGEIPLKPLTGHPTSRRRIEGGGLTGHPSSRTRMEGTPTTRPNEVDRDTAILEPYRWTEEQREQFWQQMARAGLVDADDYSFGKLLAIWQRFVDDAVSSTAVGKRMTPWDAMSLYTRGRDPLSGQRIGPRTVTQRTSSVNLTTAEQARSLLSRMLSNKLGRDATDDEVDDFTEALNTYEQAHPVVSTSTQRISALGETTNTSTKTTGGVDPGAYSEKYADDDQFDEEHKYVQAATTMYNWLIEGMRAPV